jgi:Lar family restriction alleviation protein
MSEKLAPHIQKIRDGYGAKFDGKRSSVIQLKSCPFCGETVDLVAVEKIIIDEGDSPEDCIEEKRVECQNCGALGPSSDSRNEARKSWNERKEIKL